MQHLFSICNVMSLWRITRSRFQFHIIEIGDFTKIRDLEFVATQKLVVQGLMILSPRLSKSLLLRVTTLKPY